MSFDEAKGYNLPFTEDKRFKIRFLRAKDIGDALWDEIQTDYQQNRNKPTKSYEGTLIYALCENDADISVAKEAARTIPHDNAALAVPHSPRPFTDMLLKVKACRHFLPPNEAEKISAQTESRLRDLFENPEDGYLPALERVFKSIREGGDACWYRKGGKILVDKPKQSHKPADMLCEQLFTERCRIKHPDLNLCHDDKWRKGKNRALKQAVKVLLSAETVFIDNGNPDNHGEKRYLEKVLLKGAGAVKKTGSDGAITYFDCETDPDKIHDDFPVLKEICARLSNLNPGETLAVGAFLEEARNAPYGVGGTPLMLSLAHVLRAYGERMTVYKDTTKMVEQPLPDYDALVDVVSDPAAKTVLAVRDITDAQMHLVDIVAKAANAPPLKHGETRSLNAAFEALKEWWNALPAVSKVLGLYEKDQQDRVAGLKNLMDETSGSLDRFDFMLDQLPSLYTDKPVGDALTEKEADAISNAFKEDVKLLDSGEAKAHDLVARAVCDIFGTKGDMIACETAVKDWHKNLNPAQRDPHKNKDEDAVHFLTRLADSQSGFQKKILSLLPDEYGFGPVSDWTSLHIKDYAAKLKHAREEIEKAKPTVDKPILEEGKKEIKEDQKVWVKAPKKGTTLVYTTDGTDPRTSGKAQKADADFDLATLLKDRPNITIRARIVDSEGNYSDESKLELISQERKFDVRENLDEAMFKRPADFEEFMTVVNSVIRYGVEKKFLTGDQAKQMATALQNAAKPPNPNARE